MSTITATTHTEDVYRTPIIVPNDNALVQAYNNNAEITLTLEDAPIGQPNFIVGTGVIVYIAPDINAHVTVSRVDGPAKYGVQF